MFNSDAFKMYGEACASVLAMGLQMVHLAYKVVDFANRLKVENESLCEQLVKLKEQNEDFLTMRDDAFKGRKDAEAENESLREQVVLWQRRHAEKVYHNE